jgi:peptide/nickel transport system permease protein
MLNIAQAYLGSAPWMALWPGLAIFVTVLAINLMGDGLREALDPRLR